MRNSVVGLIGFLSWLPAAGQVQESAAFLDFPLRCGDKACTFKYTKGAYTPASVNSVLDHHLTTPYSNEDGVVTAFTGEEGRGKATNQGCYPPTAQTGSKFSVAGLYRGTNDGCLPAQGLNYDSHPGYDYLAGTGTEAYAAAKGKVVTVVNKVTGKSERCIPKGIDKAGCDVWGFIGVDHGNGYVTQYGHLSRIYFKSGDLVKAGDLIGLSGQNSPPVRDDKGIVKTAYSVPPHLHFEVLKESQAAPYGFAFVDPYGWEGKAGEDPLKKDATGIPNVRLWRLDTEELAADPSRVQSSTTPQNNANAIARTIKAVDVCYHLAGEDASGSPERAQQLERSQKQYCPLAISLTKEAYAKYPNEPGLFEAFLRMGELGVLDLSPKEINRMCSTLKDNPHCK